MPDRNAGLLVADMVECCENIFEYTNGLTLSAFISDKKTRDAVLRNLEVLGEAARRMPYAVRLSNKTIEWRKLGDFRNVLIHNYFGVNYEIVWNIIESYLPQQYSVLKTLAGELS